MDCAEAKLQIEPYVAGEIAADLKGALEEHLAACAECRLDSELTRASRSTPVGPDPNAAAAPFVESIRPETAPAEPPDAAADSAGSPPSGATRAADGSWTLDSIFGAAGGIDALAERAAAAAEPLPGAELSSILNGSESPSFADEPPDSDAPTWDFEPADAKGTAKPPAGSLFFAEEALSRGTGPKKKSGVPRVLLWGAGGLLGIGLLALSIWIALTVRQPLPPAGIAEHRPIRGGTGPGIPSSDGAASAPGALEATPPGAAPGSGAEIPAPGGGSSAPATVVEAPAETRTPRAPDTAPPTTAGAATPMPPSQPPATTARTTTVAKPPATTARTTTVAKPPARTARATTSAKTPATAKPATSKPAAIKPAPAVPTEPQDDDFSSDDDIAAIRPPSTKKAPGTGTSSGAPTTTSGAAPTTGSTASTVGSGTGPQADPPAAAPPAASGETVERPIDRLHLATLNAEQNADLIALRKLRDAWRGFVRSSIGPDRARAKRELADCLWAVQTLTSKRSDQKEALAAFRDYVLNAPAGGADARTVARMRQLEDAVAESR